MTTTYRHAPGHYRTTATDLAAHLTAIADHLAAGVALDGELGARVDELTDAIIRAECLALRVLLDVEVGALVREVTA